MATPVFVTNATANDLKDAVQTIKDTGRRILAITPASLIKPNARSTKELIVASYVIVSQ